VAERIKGAQLDLFAGASHWLMTDQTELCLAAMNRFFAEHTS
jgi:pimeloyl-ACP methyl ester carboxylesterase